MWNNSFFYCSIWMRKTESNLHRKTSRKFTKTCGKYLQLRNTKSSWMASSPYLCEGVCKHWRHQGNAGGSLATSRVSLNDKEGEVGPKKSGLFCQFVGCAFRLVSKSWVPLFFTGHEMWFGSSNLLPLGDALFLIVILRVTDLLAVTTCFLFFNRGLLLCYMPFVGPGNMTISRRELRVGLWNMNLSFCHVAVTIYLRRVT
jgi:hypothetical protein